MNVLKAFLTFFIILPGYSKKKEILSPDSSVNRQTLDLSKSNIKKLDK
tara:strand:+ start:586 stop:729 length:144 start_codon:yes stop_codon:yes gene_type:complete